jgi:hypothetical protein
MTMWLLGCAITLMTANVQGQSSELPFSPPRQVDGWQWHGKCDTYDPQTIFDYIDGIGEKYRAYNMRRVWACRYEKADSPTLTLDIFDMGTAEDAFGIFTFERDGEDAGIGQGSDYAGGMLRFWKDRYFVVITALINVRPVRTHWWSGIGGCIKNYIMFTENPASYHPDACSSLAKVWELPAVKGKTRLNILLALTPLFHGRGPHHWDPRYVWQYKGLFVSYDPVAVDAMGLRLIQAKRRQHFGEDVALETPPTHIRDAEVKYGLGVSDPRRIDLVKLGWKEDILIS